MTGVADVPSASLKPFRLAKPSAGRLGDGTSPVPGGYWLKRLLMEPSDERSEEAS